MSLILGSKRALFDRHIVEADLNVDNFEITPTRQEQALIRRKIKEVVKAHGGLRPAARHLKIKRSYLGSLLDGTKNNPGDWYLRKLGLRRVTYIEEI